MADIYFYICDVVTLKSGGPKMTIQSLENNSAVCIWFPKTADSNYSSQMSKATFPLALLVHETKS